MMGKLRDGKKIMTVTEGSSVISIFVAANSEQTQFCLFLSTKRVMNNEEVLIALDSFTQECYENGLDLMAPTGSSDDH
jgi:3-isopropylmalate dehydratase small subunit